MSSRNAMPKLKVRDLSTREVFSVEWEHTAYVRTMDGVRVKLHPNSMRLMVPVGAKFDGQCITGTRPMERVQ